MKKLAALAAATAATLTLGLGVASTAGAAELPRLDIPAVPFVDGQACPGQTLTVYCVANPSVTFGQG